MPSNFFSKLFSPQPSRYLLELKNISASEAVRRSIQTHLMGLGVAIDAIDEVQRSVALAKNFSSASGVPAEEILQLAALGDLDGVIRHVEKSGISGVSQWLRERDDAEDNDDDLDEDANSPADASDLTSQYNLGVSYLNGQGGVPRNLELAYKNFSSAAEKGHAGAQYNLAIMHNTGTHVGKDPAIAATWFAKAAESGHANAAFNLANLFLTGRGVEQNNQQAHMYLCLAADNGHTAALDYVRNFLASKGLDKNGNPLG